MTKCVNVKYESSRKEHFQDLSLDVRLPEPEEEKESRKKRGYYYSSFTPYWQQKSTPPSNIYKAFAQYIRPEKMCGDNQYYAGDEFKKQDAMKGVRFLNLPPILFVKSMFSCVFLCFLCVFLCDFRIFAFFIEIEILFFCFFVAFCTVTIEEI